MTLKEHLALTKRLLKRKCLNLKIKFKGHQCLDRDWCATLVQERMMMLILISVKSLPTRSLKMVIMR